MGSYCLLQYDCGLSTKSTSEIQNNLGTGYRCLTTDRQQHTLAHRHNTGGFGTPMLVLLLSIFQHRRRADYRTGQTHSCRGSPPLWREGEGCLTDTMIRCHIQSAPSCLVLFHGVPPPPTSPPTASHPISSSRLSS